MTNTVETVSGTCVSGYMSTGLGRGSRLLRPCCEDTWIACGDGFDCAPLVTGDHPRDMPFFCAGQ